MVTSHIQEDEEPTTTALRELKEETDLEAHSLYATEFCDIFYSPISKDRGYAQFYSLCFEF